MEVTMSQFASIISFLMAALLFYAIIRIAQRVGYNWMWVFLMFIPVLNFIVVCLFAFKVWPVEKFTWWQARKIEEYESLIEQYQKEIEGLRQLGQ